MADLEVQEKDGKIYCPLKKAWHVSTPEERVRQYYMGLCQDLVQVKMRNFSPF